MKAFLLFGIALVVCLGAGPDKVPKQRDSDHEREIRRLQKVIAEEIAEKDKFRQKLRDARAEIESLREALEECESDRSDAGAASMQERDAETVATLCRSIAAGVKDRPEGREIMAGVAELLSQWSNGHEEREELFSAGISVLETNVKMIDRAAALRENEASRAEERRRSLPTLALRDAGLICEIARDWDAFSASLAFVSMQGKSIEWEGVVTGAVDDRYAPYQLEVRCGEVLVFCNVKDKREGALRGVRRKTRLVISGTIADIGDTVGVCKSVLLHDVVIKKSNSK